MDKEVHFVHGLAYLSITAQSNYAKCIELANKTWEGKEDHRYEQFVIELDTGYTAIFPLKDGKYKEVLIFDFCNSPSLVASITESNGTDNVFYTSHKRAGEYKIHLTDEDLSTIFRTACKAFSEE